MNCNGIIVLEFKLSSGLGSDCIDIIVDSVCLLLEYFYDLNDFLSCYLLFILVNNGC